MTGSKFGHTSLIIAILVLLGCLLSVPALAQTEPAGFKNVELWLYPEYDDPRLLVMMQGQIEGTLPPATVRFLVPSGAVMYSAGSMDVVGKYTGGPPRREVSDLDGWDEISYEVTSDTFRVEYYHDAIKGMPAKAIFSEFIPLYPIEGLQVIVQQPRLATDFRVETQSKPSEESRFVDDEGFNSRSYQFRGLAEKQSISFDISYTKGNPAPSVELGEPSSNTWLIIAATIVAAGSLFGIWLYWSRRKPASRVKGAVPRRPPAQKPASARFCPDCGSRLEGLPRFCPDCGTRLRE